MAKRAAPGTIGIGPWLSRLRWIDGSPLTRHVERYRRRLLEDAETVDEAGRLRYSLVLSGRAKKNWKTADAMLYGLKVLTGASPGGNQVYVVANDQGQAADDLDLAKKIIKANVTLQDWVRPRKNVIERKDGDGFMEILPAQDAIGQHGKTYRLLVVDEIHGYRNYDLLEALAPDPTRGDVQQWITSYASIYHRPGVPLFDFLQMAKAGQDPRLLFSWYAADYTTDPEADGLSPEDRANPSRGTWAHAGYLEQQRRRLPSHKYRRLHLNLPGLPEGSAYQAEPVMDAIERGVLQRAPVAGITYAAFVDMSGGSSDDAVLAIGHQDGAGRAVLDVVQDQGARPPFDPRKAVERFVVTLKTYGVGAVTGDKYAGETFVSDFASKGIGYHVSAETKSELYEAFEPRLNAREAVLLDAPTLEQQLLGLVWRGGRIDHPGGEHDDYANAAAGVAHVLLSGTRGLSAAEILAVDAVNERGRGAFLTYGPDGPQRSPGFNRVL